MTRLKFRLHERLHFPKRKRIQRKATPVIFNASHKTEYLIFTQERVCKQKTHCVMSIAIAEPSSKDDQDHDKMQSEWCQHPGWIKAV